MQYARGRAEVQRTPGRWLCIPRRVWRAVGCHIIAHGKMLSKFGGSCRVRVVSCRVCCSFPSRESHLHHRTKPRNATQQQRPAHKRANDDGLIAGASRGCAGGCRGAWLSGCWRPSALLRAVCLPLSCCCWLRSSFGGARLQTAAASSTTSITATWEPGLELCASTRP